MPDQELAGFSRVCPSCGRRVPKNVATCRCGVELPAESHAGAPIDEDEESGGGASKIAVLALFVLAVGGGYWFFMGPTPVTTEAGVATPASSPRAQPQGTASAAVSPEARAWDAAANANEAPAGAKPNLPDSPAAAPTKPPGSIEEMVDRVMPAVVLIETTGGRGSGFYVRHDTLITNAHVVENDSYVTLRRMDGSSVTARVETKSPALDLAILKVATPSSSQAVIQMASAQGLRPGQEVIVIGSALGTLQNSVSRGIVSGLRTAGGATLVQTDAAINPGNSGGPMLNRDGAVIGITTMSYRNSEGLNFGVGIDHARDLLEGRAANLGTTGGLNDIQSRSGGSASDRQQQQGEEQFRGGVKQLAQAARGIDGDWKTFRDRCFKNPIAGNYQREWFAVLVPRGIPGDAAAGCISYYEELQGNIKEFHGLMRRLLNDARRANVLPGTIRDELRNNRLDFEWDR
jgi:S1-C subfamily serine protease